MAVWSPTPRRWFIACIALWGIFTPGADGLMPGSVWAQVKQAPEKKTQQERTEEQAESSPSSEVPAFPGAEGFGAQTSHARGRPVFFVTRLDDEDTGGRYLKPGFFRRALADAEKAGGGYILFKVAGTIQLRRSATIPSNTYVAGQSAPGTGIAIEGRAIEIGTDEKSVQDVVVRHIRHRGNFLGRGSDAFSVYGATTRRVVLDHVSISFFQDGAVDVTGGAEEVTVQWSHMGDAVDSKTDEPYHGEPNLIAYGGNKVTFHHNYYTHSHSRVPYMWEGVENGQVEFSNNVVYNYRKYPTTLDAPRGIGNVLGNVYVAGKNTHAGDAALRIRPVIFGSRGFRVHIAGNYALGGMGHDNKDENGITFKGRDQHVRRGRTAWVWSARESDSEPELNLMGASSARVGNIPGVFEFAPRRFEEIPRVTITPAPENTLRVMRLFGALPRDRTDERLYQEFVNRTGEWKMERPADENEHSGEPLPDSDRDGLPDSYEARHKKDLDPNGHDLHAVYDNLEVYLQERSVQLEENAPQITLTWNDILKASQPPASVGGRPTAPVVPKPSVAPTPSPANSGLAKPSAATPSASSPAPANPSASAAQIAPDRVPELPSPGTSAPPDSPPPAERSWFSLGLIWLLGTAGVLALVWAGLQGRPLPPAGDVNPVKGKLLLNEIYPEGALVVLHPLSPLITLHPRATVRPDGSFEVSTYAEGDGAPAGDYLVTAVWHKAGLKNGKPNLSGNQLPARYAQPETSGWSLTVVPGVNQLPTWQIQT